MKQTNRRRLCGLCILLTALLMSGCGGEGTVPDVPVGQFRAVVDGSVSDSLAGTAQYRMDDGRLVGLELGARRGPGLSIEVEPRPLDLRHYSVVESGLFGTERPGGAPGVLSFLTIDGGQFEAREGTLEITYVGDEQVGATFTFQMGGDFDAGPADAPSVRVTGRVNARPE